VTNTAILESTPGWFGKIACLGDFASRRLPSAITQVFDTCLSDCMQASRAQLGERWMSLYLTSPVWRFALAPGVLDERWWLGVLMPSVDNVGRHFPLLITQACTEPPSTDGELHRLERWLAYLTHVALGTLLVGATLEQFEAELAQAAPLPQSMPTAPAVQGPDRSRLELHTGAPLAQCVQHLVVQEAVRRLHGSSLWWPVRPDGSASSLSLTSGLPSADAYASMLEGVW
jgi:type VI secretion system protein ImpM